MLMTPRTRAKDNNIGITPDAPRRSESCSNTTTPPQAAQAQPKKAAAANSGAEQSLYEYEYDVDSQIYLV